MKIIISPALQMTDNRDDLEVRDKPRFLDKTKVILEAISDLDEKDLYKLLNTSDKLFYQAKKYYQNLDLEDLSSPAILAFQGIQYKYMGPLAFTYDELEYLQDNLLIISALFGPLRPLDGVSPYRLEMKAKLRVKGHKDLYSFWGDDLASPIDEDDLVLDLASKEYSDAISPYIEKKRFIKVRFFEEEGGKRREKGVYLKMARGSLIRYMAENKIKDLDRLKDFHLMGYQFDERGSSNCELAFVRDGEEY